MSSVPLRRLPATLLMFAACAGAWAQSDPGTTVGGQPTRIVKDSASGTVVSVVYDGRYGYVRIEKRERGAPLNQHPVAIETGALRALLERVQLPGRGNERLFSTAELDEIVPPFARALARVLPEQDVSFAVSGQHGVLGPLAPRAVTTARAFFSEGRLNLIFGLVHQDWESQYRATGYLIPFEPGKRSAPVDRSVRVGASDGTLVRRADWLALDPLASPVATQPAEPTLPPPAVVIPALPAGVAPARPEAAPAQPPAPASGPPDSDALARGTAERLAAIRKLREMGAISEEEYQEKRREILKAL